MEGGRASRVKGHGERWGIFASISLAVHCFAAIALAIAPVGPPPPSERVAPSTFTIELSIPAPLEHVDVPVRIVDPPSRPVRPPAPRRREPSMSIEPVSPVVEVGPSPSEPVDSIPPIEDEHADEPIDRPTISLDPIDVAARAIDGDGPIAPGPPATLRDDSPERQPVPIGEAIGAVTESIRVEANWRPYSERSYDVVQRPDGAYHYEGIGFEGVIDRDGSIHFSDRADIGYDAATGSGTFDLMDAIMRGAGQDPYASERLGFLHATEELQERLEDEARARWAAGSLRRLRGRVASIWQDETRTPRERRRALFELWDGAAEDDEGAPAREAVLSFIREERALGSDVTYGVRELEQLNAHRASVERFSP